MINFGKSDKKFDKIRKLRPVCDGTTNGETDAFSAVATRRSRPNATPRCRTRATCRAYDHVFRGNDCYNIITVIRPRYHGFKVAANGDPKKTRLDLV